MKTKPADNIMANVFWLSMYAWVVIAAAVVFVVVF